jgi:hypothetical protein
VSDNGDGNIELPSPLSRHSARFDSVNFDYEFLDQGFAVHTLHDPHDLYRQRTRKESGDSA